MAVGTVHSFARLLDVAADAKAKVDAFETGLAPRFAWSPSDERLVCASGDTMTFRDLVNGKAIETHAVDGAGEPLRRVESIDWSRDGRWIAVGGEKLNLYDVANRRFIMKLNIPGFVHSLKFSSDSAQLLAATGTMGTLYDVATGEIRQQWDCGAAVTSAEWGPGDRFAALNADRVRIVDTSTGERRFALLPISNVEGGIVAPSGHWRRTTSDGAPIVYVAQIPEGQQTMSAAEFSRRFGWKNDPDRVPLLTP